MSTIEVEDFLEHYGVPGMKWGVRNNSRGSKGPSNRQLNKASRAKDRAKLDKQIDRARARTTGTTKLKLTDKGSKSHTDFKNAKAQYKKDKAVMGSREAKKIFAKAQQKRMDEIATSQTAKSGKETTKAVVAIVGLTLVKAVLASK